MTHHELITIAAMLSAISYLIGRFDENRNPLDQTYILAFFVTGFCAISLVVAITLRFAGK